ncbi:Arylsulfatase [Rubripirellula tenax]|uniref:Arylsulfatase n=2 Tax=Rubripirellula tenax TaxID=2528015 RepID=A0A5C6FEA7_9BACT|nr:Arylsulfatase [Rubripirellula tenax]
MERQEHGKSTGQIVDRFEMRILMCDRDNVRTRLFTSLCLFAGFCLLQSQLACAEQRPPNILFLFADDQPPNCLGCMGNQHIKTPNLDRLARRGVVFQNAFATTAICCSNRACLMTGQHMIRHGVEDFIEPLSAAAFDETYPVLLRKSGYRTGYLGKFAVGNPGRRDRQLCLPADKFDKWYGFPQSISFRQEVDGETRYLTEVMTEKAVEFLRESDSEQPFCLTVAFKEPHGPFDYFDPNAPNTYEDADLPRPETCTSEDYEALPEFLQESLGGDGAKRRVDGGDRGLQELRTVYRLVSRLDASVGVILDELEDLGLAENTVVIYSSDHGLLLGDHGLSGKWLMYENSIRVPMIVYDPRIATEQSGSRREEMVLSIDVAPTILSIAGVDPPESMQGKDMMPLVRDKSVAWREHFFYQHTYQTDPPRSPIPSTEGIRTKDWKFVRFPDTQPVYQQLFDLKNDPLERKNLASESQHASRLRELRQLCDDAPEQLR